MHISQMVLLMFWTMEVFRNVVHVTTSGTVLRPPSSLSSFAVAHWKHHSQVGSYYFHGAAEEHAAGKSLGRYV